MNKLFEFLEKYLMGPMGKVSTWRPVRAIVAAGMASIPFTIVGSAFLVLSVIPQAFNLQFIVDLWANSFDKIQALYLLAYKCTMGILSLYFAIVIGYEYTKIYVEEEGLNLNPLNGGLLAVFAYFLTIPELTYSKGVISAVTGKATIGGWTVGGDSLTRLSTSGMFTAILMSILAVQLYRAFVCRRIGSSRCLKLFQKELLVHLQPSFQVLSLHLQYSSLTVSLSYLVQIFIKLLQFRLPLLAISLIHG